MCLPHLNTLCLPHLSTHLSTLTPTKDQAPLLTTANDQDLEELAELLMEANINHLPPSQEQLETYRRAQHSDPICSTLMEYCCSGWPAKQSLPKEYELYWPARGELTIGEDLPLYGGRVVVPANMQAETLQKLHQGHQGIQQYRLRANSSVWWPGMSKQINDFISHCPTCCRNAPPQTEPLLSSPLPDYPWQRVATDLFELEGATYVVIVDYFSRFPEVIQLRSTTSRSVINALKTVFSRHGIPETVMSDNGPQYTPTEFDEFATAYSFMHSNSSLYYTQSNGLAERTVKTVKELLKKSSDPSLALLTYWTTPLPWHGLSPVELCFGWCPRTDIPQTKGKLTRDWPYLHKFKDNEHEFKKCQKRNYDERHRVRPLPACWHRGLGEHWWTSDRGCSNTMPISPKILHSAHLLWNHLQEQESTKYCPRLHIQLSVSEQPTTTSMHETIMTHSRTGTPISPPQRL